MQFGPGTSALISWNAARPRPEHGIYLLRGWAKVASNRRDKAAPGLEVQSPLIDVPANRSIVVLHVTRDEALAFSQLGELRVLDAHAAPAAAVLLKDGDLFRRRGGGWKGGVDPSAMQSFVAGIPRPFRDSLPPLAERFAGKEDKALLPAPDFAYADVEGWLNAEAPVRRQFVPRWRPRAENPAFRAALIASLASHPEWDPVLFPEKYRPKPDADSQALERLLHGSTTSK